MALISDNVSPEVKQKVVSHLKEVGPHSAFQECSSRLTGLKDMSNKTMDYFMGPASYLFCRILQIYTFFLECDVHTDVWLAQSVERPPSALTTQ
jgi:hypothetical protein